MKESHRKTSAIATPLLWAAAVIMLDQLTKWWVMDALQRFESRVVVPGFFSLTYVTNTGAAFGLLAGAPSIWRQVFFVGIALAALAVLFVAFKHLRNQGRLYAHAIGLIAGGAVGNLIDRLRFGSVVDFLDFYVQHKFRWPAFNVADSAITVGVGLFLVAHFVYPAVEPGKQNKRED